MFGRQTGKMRNFGKRAERPKRASAEETRAKPAHVHITSNAEIAAAIAKPVYTRPVAVEKNLPEPAIQASDPAHIPEKDESVSSALRKDLIGKDYCKRLLDRDVYYTLFSDEVPYDETSIVLHKITGKLIKIEEHCDSRMIPRRSYTEIGVDELKRFVGENSRFSSFTADNWKEFIPESVRNIVRNETAPTEVVDTPAETGRIPDFEAYYIRTHLHNGTHMVFLRNTDTGWRAFIKSPGYFSPETCTEQNIYDLLMNKTEYDIYIACDRRLTQLEMDYLLAVMPKQHPNERPNGKLSRSTPISLYRDDITVACYYKEGKWIPCADFENIVEIGDRISLVAQNHLVPKNITSEIVNRSMDKAVESGYVDSQRVHNHVNEKPKNHFVPKNITSEIVNRLMDEAIELGYADSRRVHNYVNEKLNKDYKYTFNELFEFERLYNRAHPGIYVEYFYTIDIPSKDDPYASDGIAFAYHFLKHQVYYHRFHDVAGGCGWGSFGYDELTDWDHVYSEALKYKKPGGLRKKVWAKVQKDMDAYSEQNDSYMKFRETLIKSVCTEKEGNDTIEERKPRR